MHFTVSRNPTKYRAFAITMDVKKLSEHLVAKAMIGVGRVLAKA